MPALCRRVEKDADNLLMGVDQHAWPDGHGLVFRVSHKVPLAMRGRKSNRPLEFDRFPQIHSAHHNNKLYGSIEKIFQKHSISIACCCWVCFASADRILAALE